MKKRVLSIIAIIICLAMLGACSAGSSYSGNSSNGSGSSGYVPPWLQSGDDSSTDASSTDSVASSPLSPSSGSPASPSSEVDDSKINSTTMSTKPADGNAPAGATKYSGTRDPWLWPFAATSIWNMPIGSGAKLQKTNFKDEYWIGVDTEYMVKTKSSDPIVNVYSPSSWGQRWPGDKYQGQMHVPYDFILADAQGNSTPNNCATFLMPDGRTLKQLEPTCRVEKGKQIVGWLHSDVDIYGDGIGGSHWGSSLSAIGGSIRKGELTSSEPIKHALKLNVWGKKYLYYDRAANKGYVWPATTHDSCAPSGDQAYGGTNPNLRMGTLLTIPKNITAESLGLKTEVGKKLFYALQNYGCYIVDNSAWSCYDWSMEDGVDAEVQAKYGYRTYASTTENKAYRDDNLKLIKNLYIVTNNSPTSIGGGGTPCKPLAPDFK